MTSTRRRNPAEGSGGARRSTWAADIDESNPDATSLTTDEIYARAVLQAVTELGYAVSIPCRVCGHPLTSPQSVAAVVGPRCRRKVARA
ncbi:DUF6011 domain-containing protein [Gordonia paraffinivorans]|uniref:DUF6011 domain-containing protein n=1 Tax=Gordonia paraffinivorans TaxID=175628 RepID=UPI0035E3CFF4